MVMNKPAQLLSVLLFSACLSSAQSVNPVLPTKQQLAWHETEFYLFMHFGPNTFTDLEWGHGTEAEDLFNPTDLDCRQWCRVAKAAGAKASSSPPNTMMGFVSGLPNIPRIPCGKVNGRMARVMY